MEIREERAERAGGFGFGWYYRQWPGPFALYKTRHLKTRHQTPDAAALFSTLHQTQYPPNSLYLSLLSSLSLNSSPWIQTMAFPESSLMFRNSDPNINQSFLLVCRSLSLLFAASFFSFYLFIYWFRRLSCFSVLSFFFVFLLV